MPPARIKTDDPDCPGDRSNGLRDGEGRLIGCFATHLEATKEMAARGLMPAVPMMADDEPGASDVDGV